VWSLLGRIYIEVRVYDVLSTRNWLLETPDNIKATDLSVCDKGRNCSTFVSSQASALVYVVRHFLSDFITADHDSARRRNL